LHSILDEKIVLAPYSGYFFYQTYPKLAENSVYISLRRDSKSVPEDIDRDLDWGLDLAFNKKLEPVNWWGTQIAIGGKSSASLLGRTLNEESVFAVFKRIREFYESGSVRIFNAPYSNDEMDESLMMASSIEKIRKPLARMYELEFFNGKRGKDTERSGTLLAEKYSSGLCVWDLILTKLYSRHGYAYNPSHSYRVDKFSSFLASYGKTFFTIHKEFSKDAQLNEIFRAYSAEQTLKYLLGDKVGELSELLGFTPINPLGLLSSELQDSQIDEVVLRIRKGCKKARELFEKVHVNCLKNEIGKAADAKMELASLNANQSINYLILENISEFMNRKFHDAMHKFVDNMIEGEMKSSVQMLHKTLKEFKVKMGWISEVKFLTFGTLLILTSSAIDPLYIKDFFSALGSTSLGLGAVGVVSKILEEGMKLYPGFNVYTTFIKWPRVV
jgi:hypothetical protein